MQNNSSSQYNGSHVGGTPSQHSSSNHMHNSQLSFDTQRLHSDVLENIQSLCLEYDQLSPDLVRTKLRILREKEQDARSKREAYFNEILQQRLYEENLKYREQFDKLKIGFDLETIKFEKVLKDKAQSVIKNLKIKQLDNLIEIVSKVRQLQTLHEAEMPQFQEEEEASVQKSAICQQVQEDLANLVQNIENKMSEASKDENNRQHTDEILFASQEEVMRRIGLTPFNPNLKEEVMKMHQKSSNGVVANHAINSNHGVGSNPSGSQMGAGIHPVYGGAATSFGGVTSGDGLPITSGSNILSPNTTPSQEMQFMTGAQNQPLSETRLHKIQRNGTETNQFVQPGSNARPRFVYELPRDFPFNDICIEKQLSTGNVGFNQSSGNKSSNDPTSGHTTSNHDVNPDDVLREFTNSLHSGGTLGAIHSSLTYYKEALASKEWSNLSPSNAYQNYMFRKNLVGEIQKLAKEISRIPTEEAKILADLSKSKLSQERSGVSGIGNRINSDQINALYQNGNPVSTNTIGANLADTIRNGQIVKGFMIGHNESSVLMDLNRASIVAMQKEAEAREIREQSKRIVEDSANRLEPVVQDFTDQPIQMNQMQNQLLTSSGTGQGITPILYQSQTTYPSSHQIQYSQCGSAVKNLNQQNLVGNPARDSFVIYEQDHERQQESRLRQNADQIESSAKEVEIEEEIEQEDEVFNKNDQPDVSAEKSIESMEQSKSKQKMDIDTAFNYNHKDDEILSDQLSPKQRRNEAIASIANRRKLQQVGFLSNDQVLPPQFDPEDAELEMLKQQQNFQQTASFAPQNRPWWLEEDANDFAKNHDMPLFTQTAYPHMNNRTAVTHKVGRHRGARSMSTHYANLANMNAQAGQRVKPKEILNKTTLDNKGRSVNQDQKNNQQTFSDQNLFDDLSQAANYFSSKSALDGYAEMPYRNQGHHMNKTLQYNRADDSSRAGPKAYKLNIKKNQIKLNNKKNSIAGVPTSKSQSRDGRLKVKLVNKQPNAIGVGETNTRFSTNNNQVFGDRSQSPKFSRNQQRVIASTGPNPSSKSTDGYKKPQNNLVKQSQQQPQLEFIPETTQTHTQRAKKPIFKTTTTVNVGGDQNTTHVKNNFFEVNNSVVIVQGENNKKRQAYNSSQLSAVSENRVNHQPIKAKREQKNDVISDSDGDNAQDHFNEIARNLRGMGQNQTRVSNGQGHDPSDISPHMSQYGQSDDPGTGSKSRHGTFIRTQKTSKSRQGDDLDKPFGTERVSFHKSTLISGGTNRPNVTTLDEGSDSYKRPAASIKNKDPVTVRVTSHSQPPLGSEKNHYGATQTNPSMIPPPTTAQNQNIMLSVKRPVVKMSGISFVNRNSPLPAPQENVNIPAILGASSTNPMTGQNMHAKKPSIASETSPYMTQQKISNNNGGGKRVIHLKRPSTNFQMQSSQQPSLIGKNAFSQRAASRVEQIDKQNELSFSSQGVGGISGLVQSNNTNSGFGANPLNHRQTNQLRVGFGKKPASISTGQQKISVVLGSKGNSNFLRPQSELYEQDNYHMM